MLRGAEGRQGHKFGVNSGAEKVLKPIWLKEFIATRVLQS
jgi:hypothetical protein